MGAVGYLRAAEPRPRRGVSGPGRGREAGGGFVLFVLLDDRCRPVLIGSHAEEPVGAGGEAGRGGEGWAEGLLVGGGRGRGLLLGGGQDWGRGLLLRSGHRHGAACGDGARGVLDRRAASWEWPPGGGLLFYVSLLFGTGSRLHCGASDGRVWTSSRCLVLHGSLLFYSGSLFDGSGAGWRWLCWGSSYGWVRTSGVMLLRGVFVRRAARIVVGGSLMMDWAAARGLRLFWGLGRRLSTRDLGTGSRGSASTLGGLGRRVRTRDLGTASGRSDSFFVSLGSRVRTRDLGPTSSRSYSLFMSLGSGVRTRDLGAASGGSTGLFVSLGSRVRARDLGTASGGSATLFQGLGSGLCSGDLGAVPCWCFVLTGPAWRVTRKVVLLYLSVRVLGVFFSRGCRLRSAGLRAEPGPRGSVREACRAGGHCARWGVFLLLWHRAAARGCLGRGVLLNALLLVVHRAARDVLVLHRGLLVYVLSGGLLWDRALGSILMLGWATGGGRVLYRGGGWCWGLFLGRQACRDSVVGRVACRGRRVHGLSEGGVGVLDRMGRGLCRGLVCR